MARGKPLKAVVQIPWYTTFCEALKNPIHLSILAISLLVFYKIISFVLRRQESTDEQRTVVASSKNNSTTALPVLRRDFTVQELREFDGTQEDGRILLAVFGNVYDVTSAKRFYGADGPYAAYAGTDASRNLATFSVKRNNRNRYDDLRDLSESQLSSLREWDLQFRDKYPLVGRLLRDNEPHTDYEALAAAQILNQPIAT